MPLLRTTPLVQLLLHIDSSWPLSPIHYCSGYFSALPKLYTPHSFCVPHPFLHPPSAAAWDPGYLKQSTSSNSSPFSITSIRYPLPYLEQLITLLLPTFTLNFLLSHTLPNSPIYTTSPLSQPLVLYHLQITAGLSKTRYFPDTYTLSSRTGSALVWHSEGRRF